MKLIKYLKGSLLGVFGLYLVSSGTASAQIADYYTVTGINDTLGYAAGLANNDRREVIGGINGGSAQHPVLWRNGEIIDLYGFGIQSNLFDIASNSNILTMREILTATGSVHQIPSFHGNDQISTMRLNSRNEVIGMSQLCNPTCYYQPFIYRNGVTIELNSLLNSTARMGYVWDINESGDILASVSNNLWRNDFSLLTPQADGRYAVQTVSTGGSMCGGFVLNDQGHVAAACDNGRIFFWKPVLGLSWYQIGSFGWIGVQAINNFDTIVGNVDNRPFIFHPQSGIRMLDEISQLTPLTESSSNYSVSAINDRGEILGRRNNYTDCYVMFNNSCAFILNPQITTGSSSPSTGSTGGSCTTRLSTGGRTGTLAAVSVSAGTCLAN